eukprot:symbB.v1.2.027213.t1/scaffold2706.1/size72654/3
MPDSGFNSDCEMIPFIINGEAFNSLESHLVCPAFTVPRCDGSRKPALRLARQLMKCEIPLSDSSSNAKVTHDVFYELCYLEFNVGASGDPTSVAVKLIEGKPYIVLDRERLPGEEESKKKKLDEPATENQESASKRIKIDFTSKSFHPISGARLYNFAEHEVQRYLLASIGFWMNQFGMDGFRFLDVASMIYLDRGRWVPEPEQLEEYLATDDNTEKVGIQYLMQANSLIHQLEPNAKTVAEAGVGHIFLTGNFSLHRNMYQTRG